MASAIRITDGSLDFSLGVDSGRVTTVQSPANPNGLPRQMLAWLTNGTVRNGGITVRYGWQPLARVASVTAGLYQSGWLYEPQTGNPYLMLSIGGLIYQVRVDTNNAVVAITQPGQLDVNGKSVVNPATVPQGYMCQGEQFLVIQAGDWAVNNAGTLPLFWDGSTIRRSVGIISPSNVPGVPYPVTPYNELPAALAMTYFQDRLWYANGRVYTAGDIVGDQASGTATYNFTDSVLKVTENPLAIGGDGFTMPSQAGNITALSYTAQLDATLGQSNLYIFTRRQVNSLVVPVSRSAWIAAGNNNQPQQLVALTRYGSNSDRNIVRVNGDLFFGSPEPAIRSLTVATRYFQQWGNVPISRNVQRALDQTNATLLGTQPGVEFDNRLLLGLCPVQTPVGTAFTALATLNFDLISTLQEKLPPAWEGVYDGLDVLQTFEGDFGGQQRCFAVVHNKTDSSIWVWEITKTSRTENGDQRVGWTVETPAYTWNREFDLKELDCGEIWLDTISGTVEMQIHYREDASPCWQPWAQVKLCSARNSNELTGVTATSQPSYPVVTTYCDGQKFALRMPKPQPGRCDVSNMRPTTRGYQFQVRLTILGYCRVRGIILHAIPVEERAYEGVNCA